MTYRYRTMEEGIREALSRKRRLRLIYKWRHKLAHTHQPANCDRGKLSRLAFFEEMRPDRGLPSGPIGDLMKARIQRAEQVFADAIYGSIVA